MIEPLCRQTPFARVLAGALEPHRKAPAWRLALSGGLDSTVLLHLLARLCAADPGLPALSAIHVNHQLQQDSADWALHCRRFCTALAVPLKIVEVEVKPEGRGLEAAAREARYAAFSKELADAEVLLLGHHLDDQVETLMLRLLRGAGLDGLGAMAGVRELGKGLLCRPLLGMPRSELLSYARQQALPFIEDPSNSCLDFDRNFLRHEVLPLLETRWPGYRVSLGRAAGHARASAEEMRRLTPDLPRCQSICGDPGLELGALLAPGDAQASAWLRRWLRELGQTAPDSAALAEFLRQLRSASAQRAPRFVCGDTTLQRYRSAVYALPVLSAPPSGEQVIRTGESFCARGLGEVAIEATAGVGLALGPGEPLQLRWRRGGESCRLRGRKGTRSLKQVLQEAGLPPWWRDCLPLLYRGDTLLAIGDLWFTEDAPLRSKHGWQVRWTRKTAACRD